MRQSSMRNQRSKGLKVKHALQIFALAVICIWLIYQLKHSFSKKQAFEDQNTKNSDGVMGRSRPDFKLGRKDPPDVKVTGNENASLKKEGENEDVEEAEEQETNQETDGEELRGVGDDLIDETDEQDQEKADEEPEHGEEETPDEEDIIDEYEREKLNEEERKVVSQEAREEQYKKDDASSAVHDDHTMAAELRILATRRSSDVQKLESQERDSGSMANETVDGSNVNGTLLAGNLSVDDRSQSLSNLTLIKDQSESKDQMELPTDTAAILTNQTEPEKNSTEVQLGLAQDQNATVDLGATTMNLTEKSNMSRNGDVGQGGSENSSQMEKPKETENGDAALGDLDYEARVNLSTLEDTDPSKMEKPKASENADEAQREFDMEASGDMSVLQSIKMKGKDDDDDAAE